MSAEGFTSGPANHVENVKFYISSAATCESVMTREHEQVSWIENKRL